MKNKFDKSILSDMKNDIKNNVQEIKSGAIDVKKNVKSKTEELFDHTSSNFEQFKQFMFAPFLLTFVISIVIGYNFSDVIKSLTSFLANLIGYIWMWIFAFNGNHPTHTLESSFVSLLQNSLTLFFISYIVFYLIKTINKYLKKNREQQWGYDQAHEDAIKIQKLQEENIKLQKQLIEKLDGLNNKEL
ncbi:MscL family protein [Fructobacillus cardui]|uniref:Large-conductance mechanosensitive channel (MscL) n=1 Tax=Fructobacillus cardui TaxID=2893170 RepID=A0ABN9YZ76_9LACO|nr:Large-conductance mechanosensitive channel (MscL) [Fructobacillus cardui]